MIKNHFLVVICETDNISHYQMRRSNERCSYVTDIVFVSGVGIILSGDTAPQHSEGGSIGELNLSLFTSKLEPDYVAGKFLTKGHYDPHRAEYDLAERIDCYESLGDDNEHSRIVHLKSLLAEDNFSDELNFRMSCEEYLEDLDWSTPGFGYKRNDYALLAAIQQRFAKLYREHKAKASRG